MTKFLSRFPDGTAGAALFLLRFTCASIAFPLVAALPLPIFFAGSFSLVAIVFALALLAGFGTRIAASLLMLGAVVYAVMSGRDIELMVIAQAAACAALVLLGPGAYSIDANVFGRRVIRIEPRAPDRGSDE